MSIFHYQALADGFVLASSPATTPTGWEEDSKSLSRRIPSPTNRFNRDEQSSSTLLSTPPLTSPFPEGWNAERFRLQPLGRTTPRDEQSSGTLLSTPPLRGPFVDGWYSERAVIRPIARTTPHDEQPSGSILSTPPLAPAFREGWQAERFHLQPLSKTVPHDEQSSSTLLATPPLRGLFIEGWHSERAIIRPVSRTLPHDEQSSNTLLSVPPLRGPFVEGWQPSEIKPSHPTVNRASDVPLIFRFVATALSFPEGWQSERYRLPPAPLRQLADLGPAAGIILKVPPLAPPFPEGWQSSDVMPRKPAVNHASDVPLYISFVTSPFLAGWQPSDVKPGHPTASVARDVPLVINFALPLVVAYAGWQSQRFVLRTLARTTPHDEQSSSTLLQTPPLAPSFPEGWPAERFRLQSLTRTIVYETAQPVAVNLYPNGAPPSVALVTALGNAFLVLPQTIAIDANDVSERRPIVFNFNSDSVILAGDNLVPGQTVVFTQEPEAGQPALTLGGWTQAGNVVGITTAATGAQVNAEYKFVCRAGTVGGDVLEKEVVVLIAGVG